MTYDCICIEDMIIIMANIDTITAIRQENLNLYFKIQSFCSNDNIKIDLLSEYSKKHEDNDGLFEYRQYR